MDEIRDSFRKGSTLTKLIYINLGVFVAVKLVFMFYFLFTPATLSLPGVTKSDMFTDDILKYVMTPSDLKLLMYRPWTLISYMFLHEGFLHIFFNLIWLYWMGSIFLKYLTEKQLATTYLLGGIFGALTYILAYNIFPGLTSGLLIGASASVSAIVFAISFYAPDYTIRLIFIGDVKLKHLAFVFVLLDLMTIAGDNPGGHISHLGGALYGYLFAVQLKKGKDTGKGFSNVVDSVASVFRPKSRLRVSYKSDARKMSDEDYNKDRAATQIEVDQILDKIARSGYNSLSKKEKGILFKLSDKE